MQQRISDASSEKSKFSALLFGAHESRIVLATSPLARKFVASGIAMVRAQAGCHIGDGIGAVMEQQSQ